MTGNTPITVEYVFGLAISFLIALLWYWVKGISDGLKEARTQRETLLAEINKVKIDYATKADAKQVMEALGRLETKVDGLRDRLDKKADKS